MRPEGEDKKESLVYLKELYMLSTLTAIIFINKIKIKALLNSDVKCVLML